VAAICGPLVGGGLIAYSIAARLGVQFYYAERVTASAPSGLYTTP
jgi:hypothetical protein